MLCNENFVVSSNANRTTQCISKKGQLKCNRKGSTQVQKYWIKELTSFRFGTMYTTVFNGTAATDSP